jgi:hypothetical protein
LIKINAFLCSFKLSDVAKPKALVGWSQNIFFRHQQGRITQKREKIIKKLQKIILSFLVLFTKLWDSGKSAALGLDKKKFSLVINSS